MVEGASNGGRLYHEFQKSKLCALHCINTLLQGPYFSEADLAEIASDLDRMEWQMMMLPPQSAASNYRSHNVAPDGNFSIQVIQKALEVWGLQVIPLDNPVAEPAKTDPDLENAFIFHIDDNHWFCVRKVNGEWYDFDSVCAAPLHISKSALAAVLNSFKGGSIFVVRGDFPTVSSDSSSEDSTHFGKWLSPEDANRIINESCNSVQKAPQETVVESQQHSNQFLSDEEDAEKINESCNPVQKAPQETVVECQQHSNQFLPDEEDEMDPDTEYQMLLDMDDEDLNEAIAASLMDVSPVVTNAEASAPQNDDKQKSIQVETTEASLPSSDERNQVVSSLGGDKSERENQNKENSP